MKANAIAVCSLCVFSLVSFAGEVAPVQETAAVSTTAPQVDLNTAEASSIAHLVKGIGEKRAEAIVKYREAHQGFKSVQELALVPGIGKRFVEHHATELEAAFRVSKQ